MYLYQYLDLVTDDNNSVKLNVGILFIGSETNVNLMKKFIIIMTSSAIAHSNYNHHFTTIYFDSNMAHYITHALLFQVKNYGTKKMIGVKKKKDKRKTRKHLG